MAIRFEDKFKNYPVPSEEDIEKAKQHSDDFYHTAFKYYITVYSKNRRQRYVGYIILYFWRVSKWWRNNKPNR